MVEAEKGPTIFLHDEDIKELLIQKKLKVKTGGNEEITLVHLQGNLIEKKDITSAGKKGYFHIPVGPLGLFYTSAYVVPADREEEEKEVRT